METLEKAKSSDEELLQKLKERREKANLAVKKKEEAIKEKNRKERDRNIAEKGKIAEDFGLLDCDLLTWVRIMNNAATIRRENADEFVQWKKEGEHILSLTPAERVQRTLNHEKTAGGLKVERQRV